MNFWKLNALLWAICAAGWFVIASALDMTPLYGIFIACGIVAVLASLVEDR